MTLRKPHRYASQCRSGVEVRLRRQGPMSMRLKENASTVLHAFRLLFILGTLGASATTALSDTNAPLAVLSRQIAAADHIVATNWAASQVGEQGFSVLIAREKVKGIFKAVSKAAYDGDQEHPDWEWDWQLQFYKGTNFLAAICIDRTSFLMQGVYRDRSGVLEEIYHDVSNREYVSRVYKDEDKEFAEAKKAEAKDWLKSPLHTIPGEEKKKVLNYVNKFYAAGAVQVFVAEIETQLDGENPAEEIAKYLCVVLPTDRDARQKVFRVHWQAVHYWGFDADDDVGQKYTWYPIDLHDPK